MSDKKQEKKTAIVIGAGVGGVATAARLARAGFRVTVLEKNGFLGGRCSLIHYEARDEVENTNEYKGALAREFSSRSAADCASHPPSYIVNRPAQTPPSSVNCPADPTPSSVNCPADPTPSSVNGPADPSPSSVNGPADPPPSSSTYRFDQGPSLLLLPGLFHRTFRELGTTLEDEGVKLLKCEPNYNIWFGDGQKFEMSSDLAVMKQEIEKWEGKAGYERYLQYLGEAHKHYELSVEHVLLRNFTSLGSMLRWEFLKELLALHPFESIWTRASKYFWTERLRRVFTFGSMYMGMSPFDAPGTYSLLQYTELAEGIWYPVGGFNRIVQALVDIGKRLGVDYKLNTAVTKIVLSQDGSQAKGVELEDGSILEADVVVNNSDLVYAYTNLLPKSPYAESLKSRPGSCSSISFYWALNRKVPQLKAHNIFLADEYKTSFDSIFKEHLIPDEPSFYVNVPSRIDPSAAPPGCDSIVVLVPVGHLVEDSSPCSTQPGLTPTEKQNWPQMLSLARKTILETISTRTGTDISPYIIQELTNDPSTWKSTFNLDRGAILGLSHSFFNVLCFRPTTRARRCWRFDEMLRGMGVFGRILENLVDVFRASGRDVRGLYMVGASAHPGTGVPICLAGAGLVSAQICEDYGVDVAWGKGEGEGEVLGKQRKGSLDWIQRPGWLDFWEWWGLVLGLLMFVGFLVWFR